ncbi:MAG TPA: hypothetical protein VND65_18000 [Candidatus Binatia bacterium]|nr:hypothetical protein [Candidatus Binatia bacterium]
MRPLLIDSNVQAAIKVVRDFAERPENYYIVGAGGFTTQRPPGDDPRHVVHIPKGFRVVYSITKATAEGGKLYRHISISVDSGKWSNPIAAWMICDEFGFPGWTVSNGEVPAGNWIFHLDEQSRAVVVACEK